MSDGEEPTSPTADADGVGDAPEVEVPTGGPSGSSQMSVLEALKGVLKLALIHDGLARGLREASKALDRRQAHMCVLNEGCEEEAYKKLVVALCAEHSIPLIKVPDGKQLGEWAGLCGWSFPFLLGVDGEDGDGQMDIFDIGLCALNFGQKLDVLQTCRVLDREGNARKIVNCSCVVVRDWGEESQERSILINYFQTGE
ncbi:40S ribosomal protein S12 [Sticta canariensis]|nr:40S ribosomal protein S12 [Sticta canariensis]